MRGKTDLSENFSFIGLFSTGIFIYDPTTEDGIRYFETGRSAEMIDKVGLLLMWGIVLLLLGLIYIQRSLMQTAVELDKETYTQSDFAVIAHGMEFDAYSHESMETQISDHMRRRYDIEDFEYFCPAFDIQDYFAVVEKV